MMDFIVERILYIRNRHLLLLDIILLPLAAYLAFVLRLDAFDLGAYWPAYVAFTLIAIVLFILVFRWAGVYSRYWRYASIEELLLLTGAVTIGAILTAVVAFAFAQFSPDRFSFPRSVPIIFLTLALGATAVPRLLVRILSGPPFIASKQARPKHVLIAGAGDAGQMLAREIRRNPGSGMQVVGFVDDDPDKQGLSISGVPIFGGRADIPDLVERLEVQEVIIAMPSVPGKAVREIVEICKDAGVPARILPGLSEMLTSEVNLRQLRPVDINDLLRREPIKTDLGAVQELIRGRSVLITGAGGSIGSEICRQAFKANPDKLILLGHGENSIFEIQNELRGEFEDIEAFRKKIIPVIADVRDSARLRQVFDAHQPDIVFHAAAHKHVPLMEANPLDALTNNILGSYFLLETSLAHGVEHFVLISTDKAVNPANIMGVTKRTAELLVLNAARRSGKPYVAVRFGNVLGSRGSVVPFFKKQIEAGGPVTVTDQRVTRYFMTIPEAVQLVLQAATMGAPGDLFMLEMGEPVKIVDLARDLIRLSGLTPDEDIEIKFVGLRPGEKLVEELYQNHEDHTPTEHEKILRVTSPTPPPEQLYQGVQEIYDATREGELAQALAIIAALVPEYRSPEGVEPASLTAPPRGNGDKPASPIPLHARWY